MLSLQKLIMPEFMKYIVCTDQFFECFYLLTLVASKLATLNALDLQNNSGSVISFLGINIEMASNHLTCEVEFFVKVDGKLNSGLAVAHVQQFGYQFGALLEDQMSIQKHRAMSRSIVIDQVEQKIQVKRYEQHQDILSKIAHTNSIHNLSDKKDKYLLQISKFKKSISQVKMKLNSRSLENQSLVKHMMEIDRRRSSWNKKWKKLPQIHTKSRKQEQLRKSNQKLVQRIMKQRIARSRQELLKEDTNHQHYLQNLRKIRSKPGSLSRLHIIR